MIKNKHKICLLIITAVKSLSLTRIKHKIFKHNNKNKIIKNKFFKNKIRLVKYLRV
jgi:hypothetical protein